MSFVTYVLLTGLVLGTQQRYINLLGYVCLLFTMLPTNSLFKSALHSLILHEKITLYLMIRFSPEHLGITASSVLAWLLAEVVIIWLCLYLLAVHSQLRWLDLVAFCSYKYVSMITSVGAGLLGGSSAYYSVLSYSSLAIAYFLVSCKMLLVSVEKYVRVKLTFSIQKYDDF